MRICVQMNNDYCIPTYPCIIAQGESVRCLAYVSVPELRESDHRPVACTLEISVERDAIGGGDEEEEGRGGDDDDEGLGGFQWLDARRRGTGGSSAPRRVEVCVVS